VILLVATVSGTCQNGEKKSGEQAFACCSNTGQGKKTLNLPHAYTDVANYYTKSLSRWFSNIHYAYRSALRHMQCIVFSTSEKAHGSLYSGE